MWLWLPAPAPLSGPPTPFAEPSRAVRILPGGSAEHSRSGAGISNPRASASYRRQVPKGGKEALLHVRAPACVLRIVFSSISIQQGCIKLHFHTSLLHPLMHSAFPSFTCHGNTSKTRGWKLLLKTKPGSTADFVSAPLQRCQSTKMS